MIGARWIVFCSLLLLIIPLSCSDPAEKFPEKTEDAGQADGPAAPDQKVVVDAIPGDGQADGPAVLPDKGALLDHGAKVEQGAKVDQGLKPDQGIKLDLAPLDTSPPTDAKLAPDMGPTWAYGATITIDATQLTKNLTDYQVAVYLIPATFSYAHARSDGADLRFSTSPGKSASFDLLHYTETWNPAGASRVWVTLPTIKAGATTSIYMFYGNPSATSTSSQAKVFPKMFVSSGNYTASGPVTNYDWYELKSGHVLSLVQGTPLSITARRIIIAGIIFGSGAGFAGGAAKTAGSGAGGGKASTTAGGGGGGYGGAGGKGGYDGNDLPGAGGSAVGSAGGASIQAGSGGGGTDNKSGGAGGGSLSVDAEELTISGSVEMDGAVGDGGALSSGGGSGGGILLSGRNILLSGACQARGGDGGKGNSSANDGGGGGGGGRIKVFYADSYSKPGTLLVVGGKGGLYGTAAPGQAGATGTVHASQAAHASPGVSVGTEIKL